MKKLFLLGLLAASIIVIVGRETAAQDKHLNSAPAEFRSFYAKFIGAVHSGDKTTVASMTSFPLTYGFDAGDEGKYTKKEFFSRGFARMFGKSPRRFLPDKNPVVLRNGMSYTVSTKDATHLVFTKGGNRWFFTDFIVEP